MLAALAEKKPEEPAASDQVVPVPVRRADAVPLERHKSEVADAERRGFARGLAAGEAQGRREVEDAIRLALDGLTPARTVTVQIVPDTESPEPVTREPSPPTR